MKLKLLSLVLAITSIAFSQNNNTNYTLKTTHKENVSIIELPVNAHFINTTDAFTNQIVETNKIDNSITINPNYKGQIVKVNYIFNNENKTEYVAIPSASTGEIKVYFNHIVDNSVAYTGNNAVNLGNTLDDKLIEKINACTQTLDIAIYNSYSANSTSGIVGAINNAFARGVQVRVIYDGSTSSVMIPLLNSSIPVLASPQGANYTIMHNKFVIFDANHSDATKPLVWTGSTNWTTAQIDGPDQNNVITIQDQALALAYKLEFEEMWGSSTMTPNTTNSKFGQFKTDNTPHNFVIGGKNVECYFSPSDGVTSKIVNTINSANNDLNVATMLITRNELATAIINRYNAGVINTNVLVDTQNPTGNDFPTIQSSIAPNHAVVDVLSGVMHHKFVLVDNSNTSSDTQVLTGSHNWSSGAETDNDENTLIVHDPNIANQYYQAFYYLYTQASGVLSINDNLLNDSNFTVYPNPVNDFLSIKNNSQVTNLSVRIIDLTGKVIQFLDLKNLELNNIDVSNLQKGIYIVDFNNGNTNKQIKLIKN